MLSSFVGCANIITLARRDAVRRGREHGLIRRWLVTDAAMNNLTKRRITTWEHPSIVLNVDIDEEFLGQRALTDFAYRERQMQLYRKHLTQGKGGTQQVSTKP